MKCCNLLKEARLKKNLSQRKFAKMLKVSKSSYNRYERGLCTPPAEIIKKCCLILNYTPPLRRAEDGVCNKSPIGQRILILRQIKLMPLKALSVRSNIPYRRCVKIERGEVIPTRKEVSQIASALGFSPTIFRQENFINFVSKYKMLIKTAEMSLETTK
jgi:transcriptional regulator with XRE-family HTH domain